jgi:hypothetical protein
MGLLLSEREKKLLENIMSFQIWMIKQAKYLIVRDILVQTKAFRLSESVCVVLI